MSTRAELSETINRLLPGEANKRIRTAILQAASYSGSRTDQLRQSIDLANRVRTGLLVAGTTTILTDTSAELSGYVWVIDFAVQQPTAVATLTIDAPETTFVREDYFIGTDTGTIVYRAGTVDALGNAFPPIYDPANEVVLRIVRRNPDGSTEDVDVPESSTLIDFAEQNIIPFVAGGKLKNSGIQVIFDALGALAAFRFPTPVRGVPAINDDEFVTKSQLPNIPQYGLISGGTIQWSGTGLTYVSSLAVVAVGGLLTAPAATLTLDAADATHPRFDVLGWRYVSPGIAELFYLKGTAAASPTIPQVNPESEVEGLVILVPALATVPPSVTTENVYLDNAEWAVTFSGTGTGNANSTTNPDTGTKAVEVTAAANQFRVRFTRATALDLSTLTEATLGLRLDLKAGYSNSQNLELVFLDASNNPVSNVLQLTLNKALLDYQFIGFPLADLTFTSQTVKAIDIIYRQRGGGTHAGFWIDNVKIQGGVSQPVTPGGGAGEKGWSPILAVVNDGARRVLQVSDWTGGAGTKPATGQYIGSTGLTATIGDAIDIRGAAGADGIDGDDGREVEFQATATHIQWRYVGVATWTNLVALSTLAGADGREVELQSSGTWLQWRYVGAPTWTNLFDLDTLSGSGVPAGGTAGQVLTKNSSADGDASWQDPTGGGGAAAANAGSRLYLFNNY